jgi:hypothetical protein
MLLIVLLHGITDSNVSVSPIPVIKMLRDYCFES